VRPLEGGWIILGNIFSSIVLLALPGATFVLRERWWTWKSDLMAYYDGLFWATIAGSIVILLTSFLIPVIFCTRSDSSIDGSAIGSTPCGVSETDVGLHLKRD
jgi:hypothetical protein